jgi:hypothetical protein
MELPAIVAEAVDRADDAARARKSGLMLSAKPPPRKTGLRPELQRHDARPRPLQPGRYHEHTTPLRRTNLKRSAGGILTDAEGGFEVKWRATADEDGHYGFAVAL